MKAKCKRCGKCCVVRDLKGNWVDCPYLHKLDNGRTACRIYSCRIGAVLGNGFVCDYRDQLGYNIPDCPYNKKGLNIHPAYK